MAIHRVVSIEIGLAKTRVCETDFRKKNPHVYKCVVFDTPENTIEDAYIRDRKVFGDALKAELEKANIKCKNFMFSMNSSKILSREVTIPAVKENMIPGIIEGQKDEYFPMDISEHKLAYSIISTDKEAGQSRAIVYAVPENLIKNYFNLTEELDGKLVALDYAGNSVYQWFKKAAAKEPVGLEMVVQMNVQNTFVMIMENGVMALQRSINYGTNNVVDAMKDAYRDEEITTSEAYSRLRLEKYVKERFNEGDSEQGSHMSEAEWVKFVEVQDAITEAVRPLIVNINRVIEYYSTKNKTARIPEIKFFGLGTRIAGLSNLISNEIGLPVILMNELTDLTFSKGEFNKIEQSVDLITCLGASIETIHFVDVMFDTDKKQSDGIGLMVFLIVVIIVAAAAVIAFAVFNQKIAEKKLEQAKQEYLDKVYINAIESDYNEKQNTYNEVVSIDDSTFTYNELLNQLIEELEKKLPKNTIVHSISSSGEVFIMSITVTDKPTAAQLLMQLQQIPYISDITTSALTETSDELNGTKQVSFTVTCTLNRPAEEESTNE